MKITIPLPIKKVMNLLEKSGYKGFIVGGCIRDFLLDHKPKDFDLTTNATPIEMIDCFKAFTIIETGIKHGTITVIIEGMPIEITTYRTESNYSDHRHPDEVLFTNDIKEDLKRRDFTMNAIAYHSKDGLIDPYHGQKDIEKRLIRSVGNPEERFNEDPLRILRGIRFASILGFKIEEKTQKAMEDKKEQLDSVSGERIGSEVTKLICGDYIKQVMRDQVGILGKVIPELLEDNNNSFADPKKSQKSILHIGNGLETIAGEEVLRYTLLFYYIENLLHHGDSIEIAKKRLWALRRDKRTIFEVSHLLSNMNEPIKKNKSDIKSWLNCLSEPLFLKMLEVKRGVALGEMPINQKELKSNDEIRRIVHEIIINNECYLRKQLNINGNDLMSIGIESGKRMGQLFDQLLEAVINEEIENKKEPLLKKAKEISNVN
jgi:tRNA nucleotidyltransferase (CCA-adding enzyme)